MWIVWIWIAITRVLAVKNLSVELMVGYNKVTFSGETCPNCLVYIREGPTILATVLAGQNGRFSHDLEYLWEGDHSFLLSATDSLLNTSNGITYNLSIGNGTMASIENIVLLPTVIFLPKINQGEIFLISGKSTVNGTVRIEVLGKNDLWLASSNNAGEWKFDLPSTGWEAGTYDFRVKAISQNGIESEWGLLNDFKIILMIPSGQPESALVDLPTINGIQPTGHSIGLPLTIDEPKTIIRFYKEDDPRSAILANLPKVGFYSSLESGRIYSLWHDAYQTQKKGTRGQTCDLNADRVCDIYDFSILMFLLR